MKVALVYDWLGSKSGGGEQVLAELARLYPDAPIYTLFADYDRYAGQIAPERIRVSYLQKLPAAWRRRPRYLLPLLPRAIESLKLDGYDVVISYSNGYAKSVITGPNTLHICYCNSPTRALWDYWPRYVDQQAKGAIVRFLIRLVVSRIRLWDWYTAKRPQHWIAISKTVAERITRYYQQPASVIYPPTDTAAFRTVPADQKGNYYLIVSSLARYKAIDLAVKAFNTNGRRLVIAGEGPDKARLQKLASGQIEFAGHLSEAAKLDYLSQARGFIFAGEEDFGLTPVEALASGTPVIAYSRGGVTETVTQGRSGVFFDEASPQSLNAAIERFETKIFDPAILTAEAKRFDRSVFINEFPAAVVRAYENYVKANTV